MTDGLQLEPGDLVEGRYEILERIGEGGMAVVFRARHVEMGLEIALKVLKPDLAEVPTLPERFQREAQALATLKHERIVRVSDFGRLPGSGEKEGPPFMVMELLDGTSLYSLAEAGVLDVSKAVAVVAQVLDGLEYLHEQGLVHRDIKPENISVSQGKSGLQVKLLDFGIVKVSDADTQLTMPHVVFGSPRYMSPEQASGEPCDHRADIYATGVVLFHLLTARPPFVGKTPSDTLRKHLALPPPAMTIEDPRGPHLERVIHRAMSKVPRDRFQDATEFRKALFVAAAANATKTGPRLWPVVGVSAVLGVLLAALIFAFSSGPFTQANRALEEKDYPLAMQIAKDALAEDPNNAQFQLVLGHALYATKKYEDARAAYGSALRLDKTSAEDEQLQKNVKSAVEKKGRLSQSLSMAMIEHSTIETAEFVAYLAQFANHPRLRRAAYERLEALGKEDLIDAFVYLSKQLEKNGTNVCDIRRWYIERRIRLKDARVLPILKSEQRRTHGFLGLQKSSRCMKDILHKEIEAHEAQRKTTTKTSKGNASG